MPKRKVAMQTRLVGDDYKVTVRPKPSKPSSKAASKAPLPKKEGLIITGFYPSPTSIQKPSTPQRREKRRPESLSPSRIQVMDSMTLATHGEGYQDLSDQFSRLLSPVKRRRLNEPSVVHDSQVSSDTLRDVCATPPSSGRISVLEIPSSVAYERYDRRLLSEPDTPVKVFHDTRLPSPPESENETFYSAVPETQPVFLPDADGLLMHESIRAAETAVYEDPEPPPADDQAGATADVSHEQTLLCEMPATFVVSSQARQRRLDAERQQEEAESRRFEQLLKARQAFDDTETEDEKDDAWEYRSRKAAGLHEVPDSEASDNELSPRDAPEVSGNAKSAKYGLLPESMLNDSLLQSAVRPPSPMRSSSGCLTQAMYMADSLLETMIPPVLSGERISPSPSPTKRRRLL